jgi:hypothetical protein
MTMAKDIFHNLVKTALINEGWKITNDPYALKAEDVDYEVDLGAEKLIVASKGKTKILVEVKSFLKQSTTHEMHGALGQYNTYFLALQEQEPDRILYLAVPSKAYQDFFTKKFIQKLINFYHVNLLVFDETNKTIVKWIEQ